MLFLFSKVNAQNQISGRVMNINNKPLAGALVTLSELNKGIISDPDGSYLIGNIPNGKIKIQFSYIGFNTEIKIVDISTTKNTVDVFLTLAIIQSQEVVITGGYVSSQHDNSAKIDVIKSEEIALSGTPNFMEALTQVPGVEMISKGQGIAKPVIRGLSMNNILVMNNGVRMENYQYGENHPSEEETKTAGLH